jgi:TonB family protein
MHEILQQENGNLVSGNPRPRFPAGNKILLFGHLRTVRIQETGRSGAGFKDETRNLTPIKVNMKKESMRTPVIIAALALVALAALSVSAQTAGNGQMDVAETERIIRRLAAKEAEFHRALQSYAFKRDALFQSIGMGGQVIGEYHRVSLFTFDGQGNRYEKISFFPMSTMPEITSEDIEDLGGVEPFALEPAKIDKYNFRYVGKERIDELNLFIFDVAPKVMPDPKKTKERLFMGRIWVDDQDFQIVKTKGKGVPETKNNKFPTVETYREHIDGRYWFPTYSYADEELIFDSGNSIHVRMKVRYMDFTPTAATLKVSEIGLADASAASPTSVAKPIEGGLLNSKAVSLPRPVFPEEAKRVKASGKVTVRVVVDEDGKVISAQAIDGAPSLHQAAEAAARQARFEPRIQDGVTVKVTGTLVYEFVR